MADKEIQVLMLKGQQGDRGSSITSIEKTSTSGNVDTYTVYLSDGTTTTFQVTNGEVTQQQLDNAVSGLQDDIDALDGRTTTNENNIETNTGNIATNTSNIEENTSAIATNTSDISNIKNGVALYKHDISIIQNGVEVYFSLYLTTSTPITSGFTLKDVLGYENKITATGYALANPSNEKRPIYNFFVRQNPETYIIFRFYAQYVNLSGDNESVRTWSYRSYTTEQDEPIKPNDTVTKIFDLTDLIITNDPTYTTEFEYEDSGWDYNSVHVTNPNNEAGTLYYNFNDGTYQSVSIDANETVNIGTYRAGTSGNIYLIVNDKTSEVVSWIA